MAKDSKAGKMSVVDIMFANGGFFEKIANDYRYSHAGQDAAYIGNSRICLRGIPVYTLL
jgi:hypothetical protein